MAKQNAQLAAFNRGVVSKLALARVDVKRLALSAEEQTNWMPKTLGPMSLRPGLEHIGGVYGNAVERCLPFVYAVDDTAIVELTAGKARFWVNDALVSFPSVSSAISNGDFTSDLTGWTDADEAGGASVWSAGWMSLLGDGTNNAIRYQQVTVAGADVSVLHSVSITVTSGDCVVRVGSTAGGQEYVSDQPCKPGVATVAFTPTGNFYVQLMSSESYPCLVESVALVEGTLEVATPWTTATHLGNIRADQSGDVIFVACDGVRPQRIERRANNGWGVVDYVTYDGPFRNINTGPVTLTPSALTGSVTLTASKDLFKSTHVGALFQLETTGQSTSTSLSAANTFTDHIRVFGVGASRAFTRVISGTWVGTLTLQRSLGEPGLWEDVTGVVNGTASYTDGLENQIVYYRIGFKTGNYTSGTAVVALSYANGFTTGAVRVTDYTSPTVVTGDVVAALGSISATADWTEGAWSEYRGFPSAVSLHEGRLAWAGKTKIWESVSDSYHSFDPEYVGDAGPINRSIGAGPLDKIRWMLSMSRLLIGGQGAEYSCRSSSIDEPLTPTNFNIKSYSDRGSSSVGAVKVDQSAVFADRSAKRAYALTPDGSGNHGVSHITELAPEICAPSIVRIAAQRNPDTRLHFVRSDGKVAVLVFDPLEQVQAWILVETDGEVEDVVTLPNTVQDDVYYVVKRTINGSDVRYLEKWAHDGDCLGGTVNKQADSFTEFTNAPAGTSVTGLTHLAGETCVCWADGKDLGEVTVSAGGVATLPTAATTGVIGLGYQARFKSAKLAFAVQPGQTAINQVKRVDHLGLILADTHYQGLQHGPDYTNLDDLPLVANGEATAVDTVWDSFDSDSVEFNGEYDTDSRICLVANAPRPCTVVSAVISMQTNEKL